MSVLGFMDHKDHKDHKTQNLLALRVHLAQDGNQ